MTSVAALGGCLVFVGLTGVQRLPLRLCWNCNMPRFCKPDWQSAVSSSAAKLRCPVLASTGYQWECALWPVGAYVPASGDVHSGQAASQDVYPRLE